MSRSRRPALVGEMCAEFAGTMILILFGVGVVAQVATSQDGGLGDHDSIAWAWGLGVTLGVYVAARLSGAHLNPAVTLALALAVTESAYVPAEVKRLVSVLATGFALFTLVVQGSTLRWVISALGLGLLALAQELGTDPATLAVAWVAHHAARPVPILSARNAAQLAPSLAGMDYSLDDDLYARLCALSPAPPPAS